MGGPLCVQSSLNVSGGDEVGGAQRVELRFVTSEVNQEDEGEEAGSGSDITALVLPNRHGSRRAGVLLCVFGVTIFTTGTHTRAHICTCMSTNWVLLKWVWSVFFSVSIGLCSV